MSSHSCILWGVLYCPFTLVWSMTDVALADLALCACTNKSTHSDCAQSCLNRLAWCSMQRNSICQRRLVYLMRALMLNSAQPCLWFQRWLWHCQLTCLPISEQFIYIGQSKLKLYVQGCPWVCRNRTFKRQSGDQSWCLNGIWCSSDLV